MRKRLVMIYFALVAVGLASAPPDTSILPGPATMSHVGLDTNGTPVALLNAFGERTIFKARGVTATSEKTPYAHAIFHLLPTRSVYRDIIRTGKIRKVNSVILHRNGRVYEHWTVNLLGQDINKVRGRLAERFPSLFFNLDPYTLEDKLTPKIKGLEPFAFTEADSASGMWKIQIWFHDDVSPDRVD